MKKKQHPNHKEIEALRKLSESNNWKVVVFGKSGENVRGIFCGDEEMTRLISDLLRRHMEKGAKKVSDESKAE